MIKILPRIYIGRHTQQDGEKFYWFTTQAGETYPVALKCPVYDDGTVVWAGSGNGREQLTGVLSDKECCEMQIPIGSRSNIVRVSTPTLEQRDKWFDDHKVVFSAPVSIV